MPKVKIYSTPTCPHCIEAKAFFKANKVSYEDKSVIDPKNVAEAVNISGQMAVPVIVIGKEVVVGFDEAKIKKLLKF
jgi:glutaredoxin 3